MDSLIFELQIIFYFQLFLSANVRHTELKNMMKEFTAMQRRKSKITD